jgi:signal transduction histidine kinase
LKISKLFKKIKKEYKKLTMQTWQILYSLIYKRVSYNTSNVKGTNIDIAAQQKENEIVLSISDNGTGISESEKQKIFQRYPSGKRKIGAGLGLYLSKQIVKIHGEKIWFESEEGKGTTFYFTLPI